MFTGGGSAGHVTVNLALIPHFLNRGWQVEYIGSHNGIEKKLIAELKQVNYYGISTGKWRRYLDWKNIHDPFRVLKGIYQSYRLLRKRKPNLIFSKGGFVSVPVVLGGWLNKIPIIIHESDITPGLANKIAMPYATKILTTFPETSQDLNTAKCEYMGPIIRENLKQGSAARGRSFCHFHNRKPVLLIFGGSLGSQRINQGIRSILDLLLAEFQIVHVCGPGQQNPTLKRPGYLQFEYIHQEFADIVAMADVVVSRAGSNSIFELLVLQKPMLLIPLSLKASRGDQILNAQSFQSSGYCHLLLEEELTDERLLAEIKKVYQNRQSLISAMNKTVNSNNLNDLVSLLESMAR